MAQTGTEIPLKSIKDVAEEQAYKASAFVAEADAQAKKSGRTRQEELQDIMMARLTQAALTRNKKEGGLLAYNDVVDRLQTFLSANANNVDPQRIMMNLTTLTDGIVEASKRLKQEPN